MPGEARANAKFARNAYKCEICKKIFSRKDTAVDHKIRVTPDDWDGKDWTAFVERLFCPSSGLQVLCHPCHKEKTARERG